MNDELSRAVEREVLGLVRQEEAPGVLALSHLACDLAAANGGPQGELSLQT